MVAPKTAQIIIDFMFLIILVCHIIKMDHLISENRRLWRIISDLYKDSKFIHTAVINNQKHIAKLQDLVKGLFNKIKS